MLDIQNIEDMFGDDEQEFKEMLKGMGVDLDSLEKEFQNYKPKKELRYETLSYDTVKPKYNYESDSGFDLHSTEEIIVEAFGRALVPTGLKFNIPTGTEIQVRPKSGLAINQGLTVLNTPGTVDSGYNGEVKVIIFNTTKEPFKITKGMKVGQAVLCPVINGEWVDLIEVDSVENKDRGENGFGSTGI